jgi:branched-chain amino acid aminotransferase
LNHSSKNIIIRIVTLVYKNTRRFLMEIQRTLLEKSKQKEPIKDPSDVAFGAVYTNHMFTLKYTADKGWYEPHILPFGDLVLSPAALVLHYSQEVFEGLKAYKSPQGEILLFRPEENAKRMNRSLERMCMPTIPVENFIYYLKELLKIEKDWVPGKKGTSLYIRPAVIATEAKLGVKPSSEYLFFIILAPVGPYFKTGFKPASLWLTTKFTRSCDGGTGDAKTGGNYAASLLAGEIAKSKGYSQVLWLDAKEHKYVEEVGAMNIFFIINGKLVTPELKGTILPGITRKSIIKLAENLGIECEERLISIDEILSGIKDGSLTECFGAGTAAVISPIGKISFNDQEYIIKNNQTGELSQKFFNTLTDIQGGIIEDKFNWIVQV